MSDQYTYKVIPYDEKLINTYNDLVFNSDLPEELKFYVASAESRFGYPTLFCLCENDGNIVGGVSFIEVSDNGTPYVEISSIFISEPHRRKKLGAGIVESIEKHAKSKQIEHLKVTTDNQFIGAKEFYQKCGFKLLPDANFLSMEKTI